MTTTPRQASSPPRDVHARQRLREAQQQETRAVATVWTAQQALAKACAKRDAAVAAATVAVDRAQASVADAQAALVKVSGLERAAVLLGTEVTDLRRSVNNGRRADP